AFDDPLKGWIAGFAGLLVAMVGQEGMYSYARFSYGSTDVAGGFELLPVLVGLFGLTEVFVVMGNPAYKAVKNAADSVIPKIKDVFKYWVTIIRSGIIG